jgi:nitroreductase
MIALTREDLKSLVTAARLAPSVHNVQPTRWRYADGAIEILGDPGRSIPVADPEWRDWRLSHGAALEGLAIALAARGLQIAELHLEPPRPLSPADRLQVVARAELATCDPRPPAEPVQSRASWRGAFRPIDAETRAGLDRLAATRDDLTLITGAAAIADTADLGDRAGLFFLRDVEHRRELLAWMRLDPSHPDYHRDGLNAEAMGLGAVEAWAAGLVLGPLFSTADRMGLAAPLVAERAKSATAAAFVLFHRPLGEDAFHSGRAFYRAWLEMERQGFAGCPVSVLADWPLAREALMVRHGVTADRHIVSVFRIGRPKGALDRRRARLPADDLLIEN